MEKENDVIKFRYQVRIHDTADVLDEFETERECWICIGKNEDEDRRNGCWTPFYYEIFDVELCEVISVC